MPRRRARLSRGFGLGLVEYAASAGTPSRVLARYTSRCAGPLVILQPLWSNPAGTTQLGLLGLGEDGRTAAAVRFGIFSQGRVLGRCRCR